KAAKAAPTPGRRAGTARVPDTGPPPGKIRIQKVLAELGTASRRACEQMVLAGRVWVNGKVVSELPCFVDPMEDKISVDGERLRGRAENKVYVLLNKPKGVVCTNRDPAGRPRAIDLVSRIAERVFPVGRLDADSTGLILLTNDGELANRVMHPRYGLVKTYVVEIAGRIEAAVMEKLKAGMFLDAKRTAGVGVKVLRRDRERTLLEVRIKEGRNREIRRMLARLGHKVRALRRVAIGPIRDRGIKTGKFRMLTRLEVNRLLRQTEPEGQSAQTAPGD
ncbi:MAG: rRNA pseudouridine synthase, partial [Planctomycetes bacterium]|nr:rRNA pseudouridine synthase [Planctomycetota bacterium]